MQRWRAAEGGNALVELALVLPIMATLLTGVADFGLMAYDAMAVTDAARAGAQYGFVHASDAAGIQAAALGATGLNAGNLTVTESCQCFDGATVVCTGPCASADQDNGQSRIYLSVAVSEPFHTLLPWPGVPDPVTLTGSAVLPVQTSG